MDVYTSLSVGATTGFQHATYYSYDVHGNVDHLVQHIPDLAAVNNQYKHLYYNYDLISGKVNQVDYSPGTADEYHHRYTYDADNRIVQVETSKDGILWDKDANYEYYKHGPLARTEIGDLKVQGLDYSYTIQGWIKGVNSNTMDATRDPGRDGDLSISPHAHEAIGKDAFGYTLGYFVGDYNAIETFTTSEKFEAATPGSEMLVARHDLWNGNIGHMVTCLPEAAAYSGSQTITPEAYGNAYTYDQLNRLTSSRTFTNVNYGTNEWQSSGNPKPDAYASDYTYDAMGNILTQIRNGADVSGALKDLDDLEYNYHTNADGLISNRLYSVDDAVTSGNYSDDLDDQGTFDNTHSTIETANNYGYDELGNLVRDDQEEIGNIQWTVYGKIKSVSRTGGSMNANLEFGYDAGGNRLWKKVIPAGGMNIKTYYYIRDAQGNEMSRYVKYTNAGSQLMFVAEEHSIYGSSRVGVDNRKDTLYMAGSYSPGWGGTGVTRRDLGLKSYELSNHLGNVLVTVTDKKVYKTSGSIIYFEAEITSINDYTAFGSVMQTRSFSSVGYRFGFNNQEKDGELGEAYAFEYRIHDARLGRFLSVDPLKITYPYNSSFAFAENDVIRCKDLEGAETLNVNAEKKAEVGEAVNAKITITMEWMIVTEDRGALGKSDIDPKEFHDRYSSGNTTLYMYNLPSSTSEGKVLSNKHARWARKADAGKENFTKKLIAANVSYYRTQVEYNFTVSYGTTLDANYEWMSKDRQGRGIIMNSGNWDKYQGSNTPLDLYHFLNRSIGELTIDVGGIATNSNNNDGNLNIALLNRETSMKNSKTSNSIHEVGHTLAGKFLHTKMGIGNYEYFQEGLQSNEENVAPSVINTIDICNDSINRKAIKQ